MCVRYSARNASAEWSRINGSRLIRRAPAASVCPTIRRSKTSRVQVQVRGIFDHGSERLAAFREAEQGADFRQQVFRGHLDPTAFEQVLKLEPHRGEVAERGCFEQVAYRGRPVALRVSVKPDEDMGIEANFAAGEGTTSACVSGNESSLRPLHGIDTIVPGSGVPGRRAGQCVE